MNSAKLKGKIVEKNLNVVKVAESIEIGAKTFYKKIKSGRFTVNEAAKIKKVLGLTNEEAIEIFLD
jgi:predicted transcriptional regulator